MLLKYAHDHMLNKYKSKLPCKVENCNKCHHKLLHNPKNISQKGSTIESQNSKQPTLVNGIEPSK